MANIIDIKLPRAIAAALRIPPNDPRRQQLRVLKKLMKKARFTEFGQHYRFDDALLNKNPAKKFQDLAPAAAPVLAETKRMLTSLMAVTEAAGGAARGMAGDLRLGVRSPPLGEPLRGMLARWRQDHPDVRLIVHELPELELFTELVARRIDVALIPSFAPWPQIVMEPLYRERMVAAVPQNHALASRDALKWTDFHGETIYVQDWAQSHAMREFYASMMGVGMPLHPISASKQTVFSLAATGFGVTLAHAKPS